MSNLLELFSLNGSATMNDSSNCCSRSWKVGDDGPENFDGIALSFEARYYASNLGLSSAWDCLAA